MPDNLTPRTFRDDYLSPAIEAYKKEQLSKHLAIHAISQADILAEVTSNHLGIAQKKYRDDLGARFPVLATVRDAHDSHKHGWLDRKSALLISKGQRPETVSGRGFFIGVTRLGGRLTQFRFLALRKNDGSTVKIFNLLCEAELAWDQEFQHLRL